MKEKLYGPKQYQGEKLTLPPKPVENNSSDDESGKPKEFSFYEHWIHFTEGLTKDHKSELTKLSELHKSK